MVIPTDGSGVHQLLDKAARVPERYREIVVTAPYLDQTGRALLERLRVATAAADRRLVLVVPGGTVAAPFSDGGTLPGRFRIERVSNLHAKVYVLIGADPRDSEAIVTSANLTECGLFRNREIGVRIRGRDEQLQRVIERVARLARN